MEEGGIDELGFQGNQSGKGIRYQSLKWFVTCKMERKCESGVWIDLVYGR